MASKDGKAIQVIVQVHKDKEGWDGLGKVVDTMTEIGEENADGLGFHVTGPAGYGAPRGPARTA
ncbi:MMPL family transporter [Streptomyces sp. PU-14G]|uniref:MMPL family transporter n=1 Tax=Streptomyces sp. PU-14G TaxID=2800808 RepID=UPI0034DF5311